MKETIASFVGGFIITTSALAQSVDVNAAPATSDSPQFFKLSDFGFQENINFYNLKSGNVTEFLQTATWNPMANLDTHLTLPVYTDGNTGAGMLDLGVNWAFINKPVSFIDNVTLNFDLKLPTDSAGFGGSGVNPVIGASTKGTTGVDKLSWNTGMSWEFNTDGDFIPVFNGFTTDDIMNVNGALNYEVLKSVDLGVVYNFWYLDSGNSLSTIGPVVDWNVCNNAKLNFGVDIPFDQYAGSELDLIVRFGATLKF